MVALLIVVPATRLTADSPEASAGGEASVTSVVDGVPDIILSAFNVEVECQQVSALVGLVLPKVHPAGEQMLLNYKKLHTSSDICAQA